VFGSQALISTPDEPFLGYHSNMLRRSFDTPSLASNALNHRPPTSLSLSHHLLPTVCNVILLLVCCAFIISPAVGPTESKNQPSYTNALMR